MNIHYTWYENKNYHIPYKYEKIMEHFHDITLHHYVVCVVVVWPAGPREHVLPLQEDPRGAEAVWELEDGLDVLHWGGGALEV